MMENSDSESSVDHNSFASVINLYEQRSVNTVTPINMHSNIQNNKEICVLRKESSQNLDDIQLPAGPHVSDLGNRSSNNSDDAHVQEDNTIPLNFTPMYLSDNSKSIETPFKLKEDLSSSRNLLFTEKNTYANSPTLFPLHTITNLHIPQYRPLPPHKLGIISEDLSSAFPVLDFVSQRQHHHQQEHRQNNCMSSISTSSATMTADISVALSPSLVNTSLTNYENQQMNTFDNLLTHSYDKGSMRLSFFDNTSQNYPVYYNQKISDHNKYFQEQSTTLIDRSVNRGDQLSSAKFSHPGGDSGISNTSPDTYSLSEPGLVTSIPQYPLDTSDNYQQRKTYVSSQTVPNHTLDYVSVPKSDNNHKSRHKIFSDPYTIRNQYLITTREILDENVFSKGIIHHTQSSTATFQSVDKREYKVRRKLKKNNRDSSVVDESNKQITNLIRIIYGILLTTIGFLLICAQIGGNYTVSVVLEAFINFLLVGQLLYFITFYIANYYKTCSSYCSCYLSKSSQYNLHQFHYHQNKKTSSLFKSKWNQTRKDSQVDHFKSCQIISQSNVGHQNQGIGSSKKSIVIFQPDNSQCYKLATFKKAKMQQSQADIMNQKKSTFSNDKYMKHVHSTPKLNLRCEYIIQGCFYIGSLVSVIYYTNIFVKIFYTGVLNTNLEIFWPINKNTWNQYTKVNTGHDKKNNIITTKIDDQHHHDYDNQQNNNYHGVNFIKNIYSYNYNNFYSYNLIPDGLIMLKNSPFMIHPNNNLNATVFNNYMNTTITESFKQNTSVQQIIYLNWLQLANNALWILLIIIQIPFMIRLKKTFPKMLRPYSGLLFVHIIAANLIGWFYVTYEGTENYINTYNDNIQNRTKEINDSSSKNFAKFWTLQVNRNPNAYLLNAVAQSHIFIVVLLWINWNTQKLVRVILDAEINEPKRNRLVHWEKEDYSSPSSINQPDPLMDLQIPRTTSKLNYHYYYYYFHFKKPYLFGILSILSIILLSIHLFSYHLDDYLQILLCYVSHFFILLSTVLQIIILVYLFNHLQSKRISVYPRILLKNFNWFKTNLLYFLLLFQLTGSICFNLIQIMEVFFQATNLYNQHFHHIAYSLKKITSTTTLIPSTQKLSNQHHQTSQHEILFLKYFVISTVCLEIIENFLELLCIPLLMVKCFLYQIIKSKLFIWLLINLITNEFCLLVIKYLNPQLIILGDDYTFHCSNILSLDQNLTTRSTDASSIDVGAAITTSTSGNINNKHSNIVGIASAMTNNHSLLMPTSQNVGDVCSLTDIPVISANWWYWIFIKQLTQSIGILFRQSMLICCGFIYFN
ncbi:unnamed protein product [Heterobilharzia americana]|nr:unnamed protein product [Heterobilharzia americana]